MRIVVLTFAHLNWDDTILADGYSLECAPKGYFQVIQPISYDLSGLSGPTAKVSLISACGALSNE
jgi:hypothetical protein